MPLWIGFSWYEKIQKLRNLIFIPFFPIFLVDIEKHLTDHHASSLGFYCKREPQITAIDSSNETRESHTQILTLEKDKNIKVKLYRQESKEQLSTPDHLPSRTKQETEVKINENSNSSVVDVTNDEEFFDTLDQMMDEQEMTNSTKSLEQS